jgi:hypothetical protein
MRVVCNREQATSPATRTTVTSNINPAPHLLIVKVGQEGRVVQIVLAVVIAEVTG